MDTLKEPIGPRAAVIPQTWQITIVGPDGYKDTESFDVPDAKAGRAAARKVMKVATSTFEKSDE